MWSLIPKKFSITLIRVLVGLICIYPAVCEDAGNSFILAGIQLNISEATYRNEQAFSSAMDAEIERAVEAYKPDVVVFPEYTSVFLALTPFARQIGMSNTLEDAFLEIHRTNQSYRSIQELFFDQAPRVKAAMDRIWGSLAQKYSVHIVAGTWFARHGDQLRNRMALYGPDGDLMYSQDKVFLTEFETEVVHLSPGTVRSARPVLIGESLVGTTICRDTFFDEWDEPFSVADVWIDIKANGTAYTPEEEIQFQDALPARMEASGVPIGLTVCLTGHFLDLFWEGKSFSVKNNGRVFHESVAPTAREGACITTAREISDLR